MGKGVLYNKERQPLLLKWFITFLRCIIKVGRASESICKAPSYPCHAFSANVDSQNARFGIHSQQRKWDAVLQGDIVIAAEVFYNLPWMYEEDGRTS